MAARRTEDKKPSNVGNLFSVVQIAFDFSASAAVHHFLLYSVSLFLFICRECLLRVIFWSYSGQFTGNSSRVFYGTVYLSHCVLTAVVIHFSTISGFVCKLATASSDQYLLTHLISLGENDMVNYFVHISTPSP